MATGMIILLEVNSKAGFVTAGYLPVECEESQVSLVKTVTSQPKFPSLCGIYSSMYYFLGMIIYR